MGFVSFFISPLLNFPYIQNIHIYNIAEENYHGKNARGKYLSKPYFYIYDC